MTSRYSVEFARTMSTTELLNVMLSNIEYILDKLAEENINDKARVKTGLEKNRTRLELVNINTDSIISKQSTYTLYAECNPKPEEAFEVWQLRQIKSWKKYCAFIEANFEYLYSEDVVMQLCAKYMDLEDVHENKDLKNRAPMSCEFYEGFIMEGKSEALIKKAGYDTEADFFWRNNLIDGSVLLHKYYKIFIWYAIFKHFFARVAAKDEIFYLDRCYMSQFCFEYVADEWIDVPSSKIEQVLIDRNKFFQRLYTNFVCICAKSDVAFFEVHQMKNFEAPWPFKEEREFEKELYPSELCLNKAFLKFYSFLSNTFSNFTINTESRVQNAFLSQLGKTNSIRERTVLLKRKRGANDEAAAATNNNLKKIKQ